VDRTTITAELHRFITRYQREQPVSTHWRELLTGFAAAADPLFRELKQVATSDHLLPEELLTGARTVIVFFIPFAEEIARSNIEGQAASPHWARAYLETKVLIQAAGRHLQRYLTAAGERAIETSPAQDYDRQRLVSNWSQRHVAFVAGLGRFGLNRMLITPAGCCGRLGSVITSLELPPDRRSDTEACLYHFDRSCQHCLNRCPGQALGVASFDRHRCHRICHSNEVEFDALGRAVVCGKCLVDVPCTFRDPVRVKLDSGREDCETTGAQA